MARTQDVIRQEILERVRKLAPRFAERAEATEQARRIPQESVKEMLDAGLARVLLPERVGGYGLGLEVWFDTMREMSKADASHGWCAGLITHHAHLIGQFPEEAQNAVWGDGPDVPVAASFMPNAQAAPVDGGYKVSVAAAPFASGVDHCPWVVVGGMTHDGPAPEW